METTAAAAPAWGFFSSFLLLAFRTLVAALLGAAHRLGLFYQLMHKVDTASIRHGGENVAAVLKAHGAVRNFPKEDPPLQCPRKSPIPCPVPQRTLVAALLGAAHRLGLFYQLMHKVDTASIRHGGENVAAVLKAHGVWFLFTLVGRCPERKLVAMACTPWSNVKCVDQESGVIARPTKHTFISDGSGGSHPAETWTANAPRRHRAAGTEGSGRLELPGRVHPGPQASTPGPLGSHLHSLGCLVVGEFLPQVLAPKGALGGPEKARAPLAGQIPSGPAWASPIRGVLVKAASAMSVWKDEIHQQSSAPLERSPQQKLCPPGFYMEEAIGGCAPCTDGIDYTNHSNTLPSCLPCTTCKSGEEEKNRCTPTKDSECQCKPGTFRGEDAPEFCQKCSTGCPDGKVMVMDCTPWSNIKCADQESSTLAHGEAPVPGELATMSQRLPMTPSPSSGSSRLVIKIASVITTVLIGCVWCYFTGNPSSSHLTWSYKTDHIGPPTQLTVPSSPWPSLFNECWHKVIGFSSIWRPQTLSNCITAKPRVDTVPEKEAAEDNAQS
ncbi:TPA: ilvB (bacterial acetolactate synthase)-like [Bos taurus]|nr:TPA: ilvB (bacterial acetolactate synthase)-like [Bos taurus]